MPCRHGKALLCLIVVAALSLVVAIRSPLAWYIHHMSVPLPIRTQYESSRLVLNIHRASASFDNLGIAERELADAVVERFQKVGMNIVGPCEDIHNANISVYFFYKWYGDEANPDITESYIAVFDSTNRLETLEKKYTERAGVWSRQRVQLESERLEK